MSDPSQPTQAATTPASFQTFTSSDNSFRIAYPGGWHQEAAPSGTGSMFISQDQQKIFIVRNFGTSQADAAVAGSAVLSAAFSKDDGTPGLPQPISIGGQSWMKAEGDVEGGSLHQVAEAVLYKGNAFLIRYTSPKASFESDASQFFAPMEQSFQFLEGMALLDVAAAQKPPKPTRVQAMVRAGRSKLNSRRGCTWAGGGAALLVLLVGAYILHLLVPATGATITLLPKSHRVQQTLSVLVSTQANQSGDIRGHFISYTTPTQTQTAQATGTVHHDATAASGNVVISQISLNSGGSADIGSSSIPGNSGVSIVLQSFTATQGATITVPASAAQAGSSGNISAYDIDFPVELCNADDFLCNAPIGNAYAQNPSPFTGGADAYDQSVVKQSDIDALTNSLTTQLTASAQAALAQLLTQQVQPGDHTALPTPQCTPTVHADHQANDVAEQVTASGTVTCYQIAYAQQDFLPGVIHAEQQQVGMMYGQGYALVGAMLADAPVFQSTDATQGTATLSVNAKSIWAYQVDDALKAMIARQIVGQPVSDATSALLQRYPDIQDLTVTLQGFGNELPADARAIHIAVQAVPGLHA